LLLLCFVFSHSLSFFFFCKYWGLNLASCILGRHCAAWPTPLVLAVRFLDDWHSDWLKIKSQYTFDLHLWLRNISSCIYWPFVLLLRIVCSIHLSTY
jgi:hypothetical protein